MPALWNRLAAATYYREMFRRLRIDDESRSPLGQKKFIHRPLVLLVVGNLARLCGSSAYPRKLRDFLMNACAVATRTSRRPACYLSTHSDLVAADYVKRSQKTVIVVG